MIDLSIVIVNWNTRDLLLGCLAAVAAHPPLRPHEIWVVDNASSDGSVAAVRERHADVQVIANDRNVGFAAANNQAMAQCSGSKVLLLNSDTAVQPGAVERLCAFLDATPSAGAVGCRLLNRDGSVQRSAWKGYPGLRSALIEGLYLWRLLPSLVQRWEVSLTERHGPTRVDHLLGACLLVRRSIIDQVGMLDEGYFLFMEETDWCRRIGEAGWEIAYLPEVSIVHYGQQSMRLAPVRATLNYYASLCRFVRRERGGAVGARILALKLIIVVSVLVRLLLWSVRLPRQLDLSMRMMRGYGQVLVRLPFL